MNDAFEMDATLNGSEDDLDLLAFCYLTDELLPAAKEAFELRLATEQPVREALAHAVEVSAALKLANPVELNHLVSSEATVRPRSFERWMRVTTFLAIASAACLAVVIGVRSIPQNQHALSPETALVWSQVRDSWPESPVAEALGSATGVSDSAFTGEGVLDPLDDEQGELNSEMPDWLMAAVADSSDSGAGEEADDAEKNEDAIPVEREEL